MPNAPHTYFVWAGLTFLESLKCITSLALRLDSIALLKDS